MDFGIGNLLARDENKKTSYVFYLMSQETGYVLEVEKGNSLRLNRRTRGNNQKWEYTMEGFLKNQATGFVLDIKNQDHSDNAEIILYGKNYGLNQQWDFDLTTGHVKSRMHGKILTTTPGKPIRVCVCSKKNEGASSQLWQIFQDDNEGNK